MTCQDLSVAGKRAGLSGARSGLFWDLMRVLRVARPKWILLENVPGLLSGKDNGDDEGSADGDGRVDDGTSRPVSWFGALLGAMDDIGYDVAWCVLDARWFGVPQRRRRVFILACRPGAGDPGAVLALSEGGGGQPARGGTAREDVAGAHGGSSAGAGWRLGRDEAAAGHVVVNALRGGAGGADDNDAQGGRLVLVEGDSAASTPALPRLRAGCGRGGETAVAVFGGNRTSGERTVAAALSSHGGPHGRLDFETENFVVATGTGAGWWKDAAEDGVRLRAQAGGTPENVVVTPFVKVHRGGVAGTEQDYDRWEPSDVAPTLNDGDMADKRQTTIVAFNVHAAESGAKERHAYETDHARSLDSTGGFASAQGGTVVAGFNARAESGSKGGNGYTPDGCPPVRGSNPPAALAGAVRRLTPTECERLMGLPDGWTCTCGCEPYSTAACRCADGPRYRALGNAVAVPVVGWIARRMDGASRHPTERG